jgi:hypothetical protein
MKRITILVALVVLAGLLLAPSVLAAAGSASTPFHGAWSGNDPPEPDGDGSVVHLLIGPGPRPAIAFVDEYGTICDNAGASDPLFEARLSGYVDGDILWAAFRNARCGGTPLGFLRGEIVAYEFDDQGTARPDDDTLWDGFVLWHRD